jgi:hypothetical protein
LRHMEKWQLFAVGAALAWGVYGPALQIAAEKLAEPPGAAEGHKLTEEQKAAGRMKSLLGVGIAYFVLAVLLPVVMLLAGSRQDVSAQIILLTVAGGAGALAGVSLMMAQQFHAGGTVASLIAGALGAIGAIFVIFALSSGGKPTYVMPTVFGLAPVINVAASYLLDKASNKSWPTPEPLFFVGMVMAAVGVGLVLMNKPMGKPAGGAHSLAKTPAGRTA